MNHVLVTPSLMIETANSANCTVNCNVLNVSSTPRTGTLEIFQFDGTVVSRAGYNTVAPGVGTGIDVQKFQNTAAVTLLYGKITVDDHPSAIRANLVLTDAKGNTLVSLDAH